MDWITIDRFKANYHLKTSAFCLKKADEDCNLFIEQIQADLGYFQHGAALLEKAMTAIQGRVEIEQAESDRTTQNLLRQKEESDKVRDRKTYP